MTIITSDHGENFGEKGFFEHQLCVYNTLLHVPLILRYPTKIKPRIVRERVSLVSLRQTVLQLAGIVDERAPEAESFGSLLEVEDDRPILAEHANAVGMLRGAIAGEDPEFDYSMFDRSLKCLIYEDLKLISSSNGQPELYDIRSDPGENHNLIDADQARARELLLKLDSWLASLNHADLSGDIPAADQETKDRLEALGYVH